MDFNTEIILIFLFKMDVWSITGLGLITVALTLSFYEIIGHLCNNTKPYLQRYIIRILLIVPIYSLNAWIAMILPAAALYLDSSREVYESFVIYSFMKYILNFLHYDTNLQQYISHKPAPGHLFPFCFLPTCVGGRIFMLRCKHGILQYVVIRPITTFIAFISQIFGFYGEQNYNPFSGNTYPVLFLINNASQFTALYCLVIFYKGYKQELNPMQPLAKFLTIKLVVFFSFFQSVVIMGLMEIDMVEDVMRGLFPELDDRILIGKKLQEFLICIDMLIASIAHLFAFSYKPFVDDSELLNPIDSDSTSRSKSLVGAGNQSYRDALYNIIDFTDEKSDVSEYFGTIFFRIKQLFSRRQPLPSIVSSTPILAGSQSGYHINYANINENVNYEADREPINGVNGQLSRANYQSF